MWVYLEELNRQGTTIILTTHYLEEAECLCRNIAIIDEGKIVSHTSMEALLQQLKVETLVLDLADPLDKVPDIPGYQCEMVGTQTLSVEIKKGESINYLFSLLSEMNINVLSMRNKSNRLEELFINLVDKSGKGQKI